jgi:F-type H+-transporting ATPase subunit b
VELDWSTFLLEIVNFLILVWILKRFLYRPVLDAVARRRRRIEEEMADAQKLREEALALKAKNEGLLEEWNRKQEIMQAQLTEEIGARREQMMNGLAAAVEQERERNRALDERRQQEWRQAAEEKSLAQASQFAAVLLSRIASPELESRLFELLLQDLRKLTPQEVAALIPAANRSDLRANVVSAFPLRAEQRTQLLDVLATIAGGPLPAAFSEDASLLGGLRISIGSWVLHANLRDELAYFRGSAHSVS